MREMSIHIKYKFSVNHYLTITCGIVKKCTIYSIKEGSQLPFVLIFRYKKGHLSFEAAFLPSIAL